MEQIKTKKTKKCGDETATSTKGPTQKGGPRKSKSEGGGEEDTERPGRGGAAAAGKKREMEVHVPAGRQKKRRKHEERDMPLASELGPGANPVLEGGSEGGGWGGRSGICEHQRQRNRCKDCGNSELCEH